jgi:hypothetical protein
MHRRARRILGSNRLLCFVSCGTCSPDAHNQRQGGLVSVGTSSAFANQRTVLARGLLVDERFPGNQSPAGARRGRAHRRGRSGPPARLAGDRRRPSDRPGRTCFHGRTRLSAQPSAVSLCAASSAARCLCDSPLMPGAAQAATCSSSTRPPAILSRERTRRSQGWRIRAAIATLVVRSLRSASRSLSVCGVGR